MDPTAFTIILLLAAFVLIAWGLHSLVKHAVKQALREFAEETSEKAEDNK